MSVIVCENESRTKVVSEVARLLGVEDYVPFKLVFLEGVISTVEIEYFAKVHMAPAALLLGDYNHVYGVQKFEGMEAKTLKEFHEKHKYDVDTSQGGLFTPVEGDNGIIWDDESRADTEHDFMLACNGIDLLLAMGEGSQRREIVKYASEPVESEGDLESAHNLFHHMSNYVDGDVNESGADPMSPKLFHRDANGKVTFSEQEAAAASAFISSLNLDGRVKAC
ncbi:MAG: hypothetical protein SGARI_006563, partial [Bacillariaceae sp.]